MDESELQQNGPAEAGPAEADAEEMKAMFGKKKKKGTKKKKADDEAADQKAEEFVDGSGQPFVKGKLHPYSFLLSRLYERINESNPELGQRKRYTLKPPQVVRVGSKKVAWINFAEICKMMNRSQDHVNQFVLAELGTEGSVAGDDQLVLKGKYGPKHMESLLRKYIDEYVKCHMCKSPNTALQRDAATRLYTLICYNCTAQRTVSQIKSGFHAVARGERKKAKAAT
ncbi:unnamed protein product [Vitrella brassicaformis CCMP3155]|uniref:Translation initiation factor IF2/IF5 domain-containing protein n=2 Tax=Vitrella brassicaformis TaxID=1169539 RepID=A0A0G4H0S5_VITBC|nr:unnamed protein product [Vitrella brassicaformis CCMP3155]|eukprot:CEM37175.1 unnamed protein product [Vitrella brassicaformis CCMP3155]